ncbi:MAG: tRNA uridine(34) 5-carboxymethylaminomethyl modification radical SAM/GNAT enzyme Elp3 [Candidatus Lokiarchaeota archaeon]|nr:tRNA uridine(34) 5-carboxymethylaminomethyl modification radical SAM/GNAT enzyme Elp3 [Candidatus Lokiarchaeota archaeon]
MELTKDQRIELACRDIIEYLIDHPDFKRKNITQLKNRFVKQYHIKKTMPNSLIIKHATEDELELIQHMLRRRSTRTISGVTVVAVMTKPFQCPGDCIYCPGESSQPDDKAAKSYTGKEPAARRSIRYDYDPYLQTKHRLMDQQAIGHNIDKVELIVMGGTFLATPIAYQESFIHGCYDAIYNYHEPNFNDDVRTKSLDIVKKKLEKAKLRLVGLTIETRPDYCMEEHVNRMLYYGATRVEIGVQTTRESILDNLSRGHTIQDTIDSIRIAKDAGLKINAHIMPNLPNSNLEDDLKDFEELFNNPDFRPDMLKIYPTLVIEGTELYEMWIKGDYKSYSLQESIDLVAKMKSKVPKYVRIQRIQRDIPAYLIMAGVNKSNLRQMVQQYMQETDRTCNCIRCREQGFIKRIQKKQGKRNKKGIEFKKYKLQRLDYKASEGREVFLSFESKKDLLGYLRLRKPSNLSFRPELLKETAVVREIRIVGEMVPKDEDPTKNQVQHRGFGQRLLAEAEKIAKKEFHAKKLAVISGIGVREYFYNLDYKLDGVYVSKEL